MKTNQILNLLFGDNKLTLEHKTLYGSLNALLNAANAYRMIDQHGQPIQLAALLNSVGFQQHVKLLEQDVMFTLDERGAWFKTGKGKHTDTSAHLMLLLYVAQAVSPRFHYEFNKRVVMGELCVWRDKAGDQFNDLNIALVLSAESVLGKPAHKGHYITLAKIIKTRVNPDNDDWNTATALQLKHRYDIEAMLCKFLQMKVVRDWAHLKQLAENV